jgi:2-polyprenyl-3-methyl-5-hydroxy-6-metoxy-1,4-benzoquinol methylase
VPRPRSSRARSSRAAAIAPDEIVWPDDVADLAALQTFLDETDVFGEQRAEAGCYIGNSIERFRTTMALVPELAPGARVLELGSNPYYLTRLLLRRGLDVTCANWFSGAPGRFEHVLVNHTTGATTTIVYDHFNVEHHPFPYADEAFDLVLCCEILEHLPNDPTHMLAEIHRVSRPGASLLVTTPNAARAENVERILRGENVYEHLSGYGVYGRHNRVYTLPELRSFVTDIGFDVERLFSRDTYWRPEGDWPVPATADQRHRGDTLFLLAQRGTEATRWSYPGWLYQSRHAIVKVVGDDLVMGVNDDVQARGFHALDRFGDLDDGGRLACWTGAEPEARVTIRVAASHVTLKVVGFAPPPQAGPTIELSLHGPQELASWTVPCHGGPFTVEAEIAIAEGVHSLSLRTERLWRPSELGINADVRTLGLAIAEVATVAR